MMHSKKFLLADSHDDSRELVSLMLNSQFNSNIKTVTSAQEGIEVLKKDSDFDAIIADLHMNSGPGLDLFWHAKKNNYNIPFIFLTGTDKILSPEHIEGFQDISGKGPKNILLGKPFDQDSLTSLVKIITKNPMPLEATYEDDQVLKVKTIKLIEYNIAKVRVMIKIGSSKYLSITNESDDNSITIYQKYLNKGVEYLFLDLKYLTNLESQAKMAVPILLDRLSSNPTMLIDYQISALDLLYSNLNSEGLDDAELKIIESIAITSFDLIKSHTPIWSLLEESQGKRYLSKHSLILAHVSSHFLILLGWSDQASLKNIFMASILHDLAFSDDNLAQIHDLRPQIMMKLSPRKVSEIKNHVQAITELLTLSDIDPNVSSIISTHHENALGSGYPKQKFAQHIGQHESVFIMAHEIVNSLISNNFDFDSTKNLSKKIHNLYSHGPFHRPLENIFKLCEKLQKFSLTT